MCTCRHDSDEMSEIFKYDLFCIFSKGYKWDNNSLLKGTKVNC